MTPNFSAFPFDRLRADDARRGARVESTLARWMRRARRASVAASAASSSAWQVRACGSPAPVHRVRSVRGRVRGSRRGRELEVARSSLASAASRSGCSAVPRSSARPRPLGARRAGDLGARRRDRARGSRRRWRRSCVTRTAARQSPQHRRRPARRDRARPTRPASDRASVDRLVRCLTALARCELPVRRRRRARVGDTSSSTLPVVLGRCALPRDRARPRCALRNLDRRLDRAGRRRGACDLGDLGGAVALGGARRGGCRRS